MNAGGRPAADPFADELCEKCGRCCCRKFILAGRVYFTPFYCPHLNLETRLCRVYAHRREVNPECIPVRVGLHRGVFPADCPYVAGIEDYRAPVEDLDFFGLGELAREVAREVGVGDEEFDQVRREHLERKSHGVHSG
ncbi:MAG: CxxCxxCC domain-containing protein [Planctomycetota bacterium]